MDLSGKSELQVYIILRHSVKKTSPARISFSQGYSILLKSLGDSHLALGASLGLKPVSRSSREDLKFSKLNRRDEVGIQNTGKAIYRFRVGLKLARIFIAEDEVV